jgi:glutamine synthetase
LSAHELKSRYEIQCEIYSHTINIEAKLMVDILNTQVLPAAFKYQKDLAKSIKTYEEASGKKAPPSQLKILNDLSNSIDTAIKRGVELEKERAKAAALPADKKGKAFCDKVKVQAEELRQVVDHLESIIDDTLWPLPKYRELLFMV